MFTGGWCLAHTPLADIPLRRHSLADTPWLVDTPHGRHTLPGRHTPLQIHPLWQTHPLADTHSLADTPPWQAPTARHPPWQTPDCRHTPFPLEDDPLGRHPLADSPPSPWEMTPCSLREQIPPPGADTLLAQTPPEKHVGRYGQCAGGNYPTGMQSCFLYCIVLD